MRVVAVNACSGLRKFLGVSGLTVASLGTTVSAFAQEKDPLKLPDRPATVGRDTEEYSRSDSTAGVTKDLHGVISSVIRTARDRGLRVRISHPPGLGDGEWKSPLVILGQIHSEPGAQLAEKYASYAQELAGLSEIAVKGGIRSIFIEGAAHESSARKDLIDSLARQDSRELAAILVKKYADDRSVNLHGAEDRRAYRDLGAVHGELKRLGLEGGQLYSRISSLLNVSKIAVTLSPKGDLLDVELLSEAGEKLKLDSSDYYRVMQYVELYSSAINSDCEATTSITSAQKREDYLVYSLRGPALAVFGAYHASNIVPEATIHSHPADVLGYQRERSIVVILPPLSLLELDKTPVVRAHVSAILEEVHSEILRSKVILARTHLKNLVDGREASPEKLPEIQEVFTLFDAVADATIVADLREDLESAFRAASPICMSLLSFKLTQCYQACGELAPATIQEHIHMKFREAKTAQDRRLIKGAAQRLSKVGVVPPPTE